MRHQAVFALLSTWVLLCCTPANAQQLFGCKDGATVQALKDAIEEVYAPSYREMQVMTRMPRDEVRKHFEFYLVDQSIRPKGYDKANAIFECTANIKLRMSNELKNSPTGIAVGMFPDGFPFLFTVQTIPNHSAPVLKMFEIGGKQIY